MSRRPIALVNPRSKGGRTGRDWPAIQAQIEAAIGPIDSRFTSQSGGAAELARAAIGDGYDWLIAVGGDGTINECVNGLLENNQPLNPQAKLSFVMRGTGNDFRRSTSGAKDLAGDVAALKNGRPRVVDAGRLDFIANDGRPALRYFDNITSFGMGGEVDHRVNQAGWTRRLGGTFVFLAATLTTLLVYRNKRVRLSFDDGPAQEATIRLVCVCNGRFAGGNMQFAPLAELDDGYFDVLLLKDVNRRQALRHMPKIYRGRHVDIDHPQIESRRARKLTASSDEIVLLDVDGEAPGRLPATLQVLPGVLRLHY